MPRLRIPCPIGHNPGPCHRMAQTTHMPQLVNLFLVIFGVIAVGAGLFDWRSAPVAALVSLVVGAAMVALAYFSDRRRERRKAQRERAAVQGSVTDFVERALASGESLKVAGAARYVVAALALTVIGAGLLYASVMAAKHDAIMIAVAAGLLLSGLLVFLRILPATGRPALELTTLGFSTPRIGRISWHDVSGVALRKVSEHNGKPIHSLMLRVRRFAHVAPRLHWTDRLLAMVHLGPIFKDVVTVTMPSSKQQPQAVYTLARKLWKQATGRDHEWSPLMSDEYNEALKRIGDDPDAIGAALADPERISGYMAQMDSDMTLLARDGRRLREGNRGNSFVWVIGLLLVMAWPWIRHALHF